MKKSSSASDDSSSASSRCVWPPIVNSATPGFGMFTTSPSTFMIFTVGTGVCGMNFASMRHAVSIGCHVRPL
jgi:hypothetical protein